MKAISIFYSAIIIGTVDGSFEVVSRVKLSVLDFADNVLAERVRLVSPNKKGETKLSVHISILSMINIRTVLCHFCILDNKIVS